MILVSLERTSDGIIRRCEAKGHAGAAARGDDLVCAAVSILIRTAGRTMEGKAGVTVKGSAPEPGSADFRLLSFEEENREWLMGLGDGLLTGLLDLQDEYPEYCRINFD